MYVGKLDRNRQLKKILEVAGYYQQRQTSIDKWKAFCEMHYFPLNKEISIFIQSYADLPNDCIYLGFDNAVFAEFDFIIRITVNESETWLNNSAIKAIKKQAEEAILPLGSFGYYYEGCIAIGISGKLYVWHDYNNKVHAFENLISAIDYELRTHKKIAVLSNEQNGK